MSRAVALLFVAGCGRIGFEPSVTDGATADVAPDTSKVCTPVGHDEDDDGIDDTCDVCPHLADAEQQDTDGDLVGDACDPQPAISRQRIVLFEPFKDLTGWMRSSNEVATGDELILDASAGGVKAVFRSYTPATDLFEIGVKTQLVAPGGQALVMINLDTGSTGNYFCEIYDNGSALLQYTYTIDGINYVHPGISPLASRLAQGAGRLRLERDAATVRCATTWNGQSLFVGGATPALAADTLVLYAESVHARIQYIVQIRTE